MYKRDGKGETEIEDGTVYGQEGRTDGKLNPNTKREHATPSRRQEGRTRGTETEKRKVNKQQ